MLSDNLIKVRDVYTCEANKNFLLTTTALENSSSILPLSTQSLCHINSAFISNPSQNIYINADNIFRSANCNATISTPSIFDPTVSISAVDNILQFPMVIPPGAQHVGMSSGYLNNSEDKDMCLNHIHNFYSDKIYVSPFKNSGALQHSPYILGDDLLIEGECILRASEGKKQKGTIQEEVNIALSAVVQEKLKPRLNEASQELKVAKEVSNEPKSLQSRNRIFLQTQFKNYCIPIISYTCIIGILCFLNVLLTGAFCVPTIAVIMNDISNVEKIWSIIKYICSWVRRFDRNNLNKEWQGKEIKTFSIDKNRCLKAFIATGYEMSPKDIEGMMRDFHGIK